MATEKVAKVIPNNGTTEAASPATTQSPKAAKAGTRKFRIGLSADFFDGQNKPKFPSFDLTPLKNNRRVDMVIVQVEYYI